jgi:hypothetical protein
MNVLMWRRMYPDWQYWYWLRSIFYKKADFRYKDKEDKEVSAGLDLARTLTLTVGMGVAVVFGIERIRPDLEVGKVLREFDAKALLRSISGGQR